MKLQRSTKKHKELFREWQKQGRMEETTCREIRNGKHFVDPKVLSFTFFIRNTKEPAGKFNCFNINKRNNLVSVGIPLILNIEERELEQE